MRRFARVSAAFDYLVYRHDKTPMRVSAIVRIAPVANPAFNGSYVGSCGNQRVARCLRAYRPRRALALLKEKATRNGIEQSLVSFDVADEDYKVGGT